jgi:hypothetical protein
MSDKALASAAQRRLAKMAKEESGTGGTVNRVWLSQAMFTPDNKKYGEVDIAKRRLEDMNSGSLPPDQYVAEAAARNMDLNPLTYLKSVYRHAPGGVESAIAQANKHRTGESDRPLASSELDRSIPTMWNSNLHEDNPGLYEYSPERIAFSQKMPVEYTLPKVARHELDHAINRNEPRAMYDQKPTASITSPRTNASWISRKLEGEAGTVEVKPTGEAPGIDQYYQKKGEARAEFLAPIKHWGVERGIFPKTESDAKALFDRYMKETGMDKKPVGDGENLNSRRPVILRRLKRYLENKKGGMLELLKVVESGQESGEV